MILVAIIIVICLLIIGYLVYNRRQPETSVIYPVSVYEDPWYWGWWYPSRWYGGWNSGSNYVVHRPYHPHRPNPPHPIPRFGGAGGHPPRAPSGGIPHSGHGGGGMPHGGGGRHR